MSYIIHPEAPTDAEGNPIHPEKDHHICGRTKSEDTTPTEHGRERDDVEYCMLRAGHGTTDPSKLGDPGAACTHHGGDSPAGEDHGEYKHGAFSEYIGPPDLSDEEQAAMDAMLDAFNGSPSEARAIAQQQAAEVYMRYQRSGDPRFLQEYRQLAKAFDVIPNSQDINVEAEQTVTHEGSAAADRELVLEVLREMQAHESDDADADADPDSDSAGDERGGKA